MPCAAPPHTANIDTHTARFIQHALQCLLAGRTSLVLAYRLSTIRNADKIVVLDRGQVTERGRHAELLARQGVCARLYAVNYGPQRPGAASPGEDGIASAGTTVPPRRCN